MCRELVSNEVRVALVQIRPGHPGIDLPTRPSDGIRDADHGPSLAQPSEGGPFVATVAGRRLPPAVMDDLGKGLRPGLRIGASCKSPKEIVNEYTR